MTKTSKIVLKGAIVNCGLATALINMVICYLTLAKVSMFLFTELSVNFLGTAIGCGLLCPLFGGIILKPLQKEPLNFEDKSKINGYIIKDYDGKIAVFDINDEEKPSKITPISVKDLPEADKNLLKELFISLILLVLILSFFIITTLFHLYFLVSYWW